MKVIIQIPCYCEEDMLPITVAALPRTLLGVDAVEWLVVDDGSTDRTVDVARELGVHHIVPMGRHLGLARAFEEGIQAALQAGADVIVNTDADNQYCAEDIEKLIEPILENRADMVIGARPIDQISHFSPVKRFLQRAGTWVVRRVSGANVEDAPSGFRAFNYESARSIRVFSHYSYTIETIIQAKQNNFRILSVPVRVNPCLRRSRLISNTFFYVLRSAETLLRIFTIYYPFRFFMVLFAISLAPGLFFGGRYVLLRFVLGREVQVYNLQLSLGCLLFSTVLFSIAVIGDILSVNRRMLERIELGSSADARKRKR